MIKQIFEAIENALKDIEYFEEWNFFRSDSEKQQGKQNKGKVPFLRLVFDRDTSRSADKRVSTEKTAYYHLDIVKDTQYTDKDDLARILEVEDIIKATEKAVLYPVNGDFLSLTAVRDIRLDTTFEQIQDITFPNILSLKVLIEVDYFRVLRG